MGKTFSTDNAHQKRHFIRQSKERYADECGSDQLNIYAAAERSFKVDAVRFGNQRKCKALAKLSQRRSDRRRNSKHSHEDEE